MIIDLQRRIMEAGRIRIGQQVPTSSGHTRPAKLDTFRLTSADKTRIEEAARLYGGEVRPWKAPAGAQWEVITDAKVLNVIIPPSDMAFSQAYELWSGGGCLRRCDGAFEQLGDQACLCDPEARECDIHTRLSVLLRDLNGLGVWRIDTQGYYAAVELAGAVQVIAAAAGRGALLPARLRVDERSVIRRIDGKPQTFRFVVPVLDIDITPGQLLGQAVGLVSLAATAAIDNGPAPAMLPVPPAPEWPVEPVAEQAAIVDTPPKPKPRSNAAQPVPPTGLEPRTATEALAQAEAPPPRHIVNPESFRPDEAPFVSPVPVEPTQPVVAAAVVDTPALPLTEEEAGAEDDAWAALYDLLDKGIDTTKPMKDMQAQVRHLFDLMTAVDLWKPGHDGTDPLHLALTKVAGTAHLTELKLEPLRDFCTLALKAARDAVWKATE